MFANIFTKTLRDRWLGTAIAAASLILLLLFAMSVYRDIDLGIYTELPEAFRAIVGISADADVGSLAIGVFFTGYGAWILAGLMIAAGSASIASEESKGTIGLLLGNPKSRSYVLLSKAASMILLTVSAVAVLWGSMYLVAKILNVDITGMDVGAISFHLIINTLFFGFLAMAIGAWTGSRGSAIGIAVGLMFISIFAIGIFSIIEGWGNAAKVFPWYYLNGSEPMLNGINWGHMGIMSAAIIFFTITSVIGVNRRDLKGQSIGVTLLDRFRYNRITQKIAEKLAGSIRVSQIWIKTLSEHQGLLIITGAIMFFVMGLLVGPIYNFIPEGFLEFTEIFPEALLAAFGSGDLGTPEGWYQIETFGLMAPIVLMIVTITVGARSLAGEEEQRTMGLLLANPIKRSRIVIEKLWAMIISAFVVGFATFLGVWFGSLLGDLGIKVGNIAATCLLVTLLGLVIGALALTLSAATGKIRVAVFGSIGAAIVFYLTSSFLPLSDNTAGYAKLSPYYYYLGSDPLFNGMDWGHGGILAGFTLILVFLSILLFQRRDLR